MESLISSLTLLGTVEHVHLPHHKVNYLTQHLIAMEVEMENEVTDALTNTEGPDAAQNLEISTGSEELYVREVDINGFFVVKFINTCHKALNDRVAILPIPYITKDEDDLYAKFIEPPYTKKRLSYLINIVKKRAEAPNMLSYPCQILMYHETYEQSDKSLAEYFRSLEDNNKNNVSAALQDVPILTPQDESSMLPDVLKLNSGPATKVTEEVIGQNNFHLGENSGDVTIEEVTDQENFGLGEKREENNTKNNSTLPMPSSFKDVIEEIVKKQFAELSRSFTTLIDNKFKTLDSQIINIGTELNQIKVLLNERRPLIEQGNIMSFSTFKETYPEYTFPLKSIQELTAFNNSIKENSTLRQDLKKVLFSNINTESSMKVNLTMILKHFVSGALMTQHTAQKEVQNKAIFSSTTLFRHIEAAMLECYKESYKLQNKVFDSNNGVVKALGAVINCATDWDGKRQKRIPKRSRRDPNEDNNATFSDETLE